MDHSSPRSPHMILAECEKMAQRFAKPLVNEFLKEADARLLELAEKAKTNAQQVQILEISRHFKQKKADVDRIFLSELAKGFSLFRAGKLGGKPEAPVQQHEDAFSALSLVADDKLEVDLAQASFARRAETRYAQELYALNQRLSILAGGKKITEDGSPVGPAQWAHCFQQGIAILATDIKMTTLLYRMFEKNLLPEMGKLYTELNNFLIAEKILPNLRYSVPRSPSPTGSTQAVSAPAPASTSHTQSQPVVQAPMQSTMPQHPAYQQPAYPHHPGMMQHTGMQQAPGYPSPMTGFNQVVYVPQVPREIAASIQPPSAELPSSAYQQQLYGAIHNMQQYVVRPPNWRTGHGVATAQEVVSVVQQAQEQVAFHADRLEQDVVQPCETIDRLGAVSYKLQQEVSQKTGKNLDDEKASAVDLVGMIFESLLADSKLHDNVKSVLSYLHTPFIKIAFLDPELFAKPEHPARQLLNALEETGTKWVNADGSSQFKAYPKIKAIVRRILLEFDNDLSLIEELRDEIREYNLKTQNNVRLLEQREAQKAEGEDRIRQIKKRVHQTVKEHIDGKKLPSPLIVLLLHPWSEYLTFVLLRHGDQSEQWKEGIETIDNAIWSIQPKATPEEQKRVVVLQDKLQAILQAGFDTISYDQAKAKRLLDSIHEMQAIALQNKAAQPAPALVVKEIEATAVGVEETRQLDIQPETAAERELVDKLRMVEFGTWMDFDQLNGQANLRVKIAWFNAKTLQYMLVNSSGKQVALMSALELARHMLSRNARIINGIAKPFFERALENIFARMQTEAA